MTRARRRRHPTTAEVFAAAVAAAPPAYGHVGTRTPGPFVNAWDEEWETTRITPTGSVDLTKAGGR